MKVFIAGGSGAIGRRLIPLLTARGHQVVATTRTPAKSQLIEQLGAKPVVLNGLDRSRVLTTVLAERPEVVVHQMTDLSSLRNLRRVDQELATTNQLRTDGAEFLLEAARRAEARAFVAQSYGGWLAGSGPRIQTEETLIERNPPSAARRSVEAVARLERLVTGASGVTGVALRYGSFYGPGTSISRNGEVTRMVRERKFPIIGDGGGVSSFIHIDDAARATAIAIERTPPAGVYNVVDDEPAEIAVWLPELAKALGAPEPRRMPAWLGRLFVGEPGIYAMTRVRGWSNEKARRELGWSPDLRTWREGFRTALD